MRCFSFFSLCGKIEILIVHIGEKLRLGKNKIISILIVHIYSFFKLSFCSIIKIVSKLFVYYLHFIYQLPIFFVSILAAL